MRYNMGDADEVHHAAYLRAALAHDENAERTYLICYYHVAAVEKTLHTKNDTATTLPIYPYLIPTSYHSQ